MLGMIGTGDWASEQRPKSWREMILLLYSNGSVPLTALTAKMSSEKLTDHEFNWWTLALQRRGGAITGPTNSVGVYVDTAMSQAYVYNTHQATIGIAGGTIYVKVAAATVAHFREGHLVRLVDADRPFATVRGKVLAVDANGASSKITVELLESDDNDTSASTYNLTSVDTILVSGDVHAEKAEGPEALHYTPTKVYNYAQIFRQSLDMSRRALLTKLRTGDAYQEVKRQGLEYHTINMEESFQWGIAYEGTGSSGTETVTQGIITALRTNNSAACSHFPDASGYTTDTWKVGGKDWLNAYLEVLFRYGDSEKLALCGSTALWAINTLAETYGNIQLTPGAVEYGIKIVKWVTPQGELDLKVHPLYSLETTMRDYMVIFEPRRLKYRFLTDTTFKADPNRTRPEGGHQNKIDGIYEEWLTDAGLEMHHYEVGGVLTGLGSDGRSAS